MASLTPGMLVKLVENSKNRSVKVTSQHRSALLQVIEIVPSLVTENDPWKNRGFYLKVSDSLNATYVSIADEDVDLIFNNKIQLGQFVHVTRFDPGSPFPVVKGMKPVARKSSFVGNPKDLISNAVELMNKERGRKKLEVKTTKVKRVELGDVKSRRASMENGRVGGMETRRLSLDSRKGWDKSAGIIKNGLRSKGSPSSSDSASVLSDTKASPRRDSLLKGRILNKSPLKCQSNSMSINTPRKVLKKEIKSPSETNISSKPLKKEIKSPSETSIPNQFVKVPLKFQKWCDQSISWDLLPSGIHDSSKDVIRCREAAFLAAVDALQEATAAESVIICMSRFAKLCESAPNDSPGILIEHFLDLHQSMHRKASVVDALLEARCTEAKTSVPSSSHLLFPELHNVFLDKNVDAASWVKAAVETNLSKFSLLNKQDNSKNRSGDQHHYILLEQSVEPKEVKMDNFPQVKRNPQIHSKRRLGHSVVKKANDEKVAWSKGQGLKDVSSLAERLLLTSRGWFLKYLEDSLNVGFGLNKNEGDNEVGNLLGQLKRVNQWLEDATGDKFEVDEKVEKLRKKLYAFLLENLDSAIVASR